MSEIKACRNNGEHGKRLIVPKWVLIVWLKIPNMPQTLSAQFVCPKPKALDFNEKRLFLGVRSP